MGMNNGDRINTRAVTIPAALIRVPKTPAACPWTLRAATAIAADHAPAMPARAKGNAPPQRDEEHHQREASEQEQEPRCEVAELFAMPGVVGDPFAVRGVVGGRVADRDAGEEEDDVGEAGVGLPPRGRTRRH